MSSFLTSLAGMALGVAAPGAARLSLPPRYAAAPEAGWIETPAEGRAVGVARADPIIEPARRPAVEAVPDAEPPADRRSAEVPAEPRPRPLLQAAETPQASRPTITTESPVRIVPPEAVRPVPAARVREDHPRADAQVAHPPAIDTVPPRPRAEIGTAPPRAPLTAATLANRAPAQREPRPIVHVTIDRIDIRAPRDAAKAEPAPKRARAEPQISLADYLGARR